MIIKIWDDLIDSVGAKHLQARILKQVKKGSVIYYDTLRGFTGIAAKGGIRHERLHLYLGEYVWRYNYRHMNL